MNGALVKQPSLGVRVRVRVEIILLWAIIDVICGSCQMLDAIVRCRQNISSHAECTADVNVFYIFYRVKLKVMSELP